MMQPNGTDQPNEGHPPEKRVSMEKARQRSNPSIPTVLSQSPTALNLLRCLRRRLTVALCLGAILGGVAGVGAWFFAPPPKHLVRTQLKVPVGSPYFFRTSEQIPNLESHQRNQVALCKSRLVLSSALRDPEVSNLPLLADKIEPIAWLEKEVQVDFSVAPEIMRIAMHGLETSDLVILVNAVRRAYIREVVDNQTTQRKQRLSFLADLIQKYEDKLKAWRETQKSAAELVGTKSSTGRELILSFVHQQLGMTQKDLLTAKTELWKERLRLSELKAQEQTTAQLKVSESAIVAALAKEEEIRGMKEKVQQLEAKIAEWIRRSPLGDKHPSVVLYRNDMAKLESDIREANDRLSPRIIANLRETARIELQNNLKLAQARIVNLENMEKFLQPELDRLQDRVSVLNKQGFKLDVFEEDVSHLEVMTRRLKDEHEGLNVELQAPPRVSVIEDATVTRVDVQTRKMMMTGGASAAGLALALFGIAWLEHRSRRVDQVNEVVHGLGMKLVGTVPKVASPAHTPLGKSSRNDHSAQQLLTDSIDATRTLLLHFARSQALRTVMVSSAVAGEGKTSLSCRLAVSLARAGLRTLLIDADTRNPSVHKVFGGTSESGFCEVLCGKAEPRSSLRTTPLPNLFFLPAGRWSDLLPAVLDKRGAGALFNQFHEDFDIILVDSPPILPVADALQIGQQVDGVLLSVLCQVSRLDALHAASQRLEELNIRTVGVVISGVEGQLYGAKYPYADAHTATANVKA